ncbi:HD domain-containing protein [Delftia tsuruhatensis]|uniref:HD domain-containing protein n=1 Tax=Delftia tsuruhatensis TaxID=180282 RepID=UPI002260F55F|nr:N-methyl-D-aspartate receptor NMDAR2C subunit [Delftia tsuruhatensis]MCX7503949.1 N-methyl-D-aspartate receptor NMDAR2C subunit [Delftia tsuruhatensis]
MTQAGPGAEMPSANDASLQTWQASWQHAWSALGASAPQPVLAELLQSYSEPQRHYHTLQHLGEAMGLLQPALGLAAHPGEVALALWFHDAVYETQAKDNEARSADWAVAVVRGQGLPAEVAGRVHGLIMATCHTAQPSGIDAQLLVDADLGILAADPLRFAEYELQVRAEYEWVPLPLYRAKRREVLQGFMQREAIYCTDWFRQRLEARARCNLAQALGL